jgi:uncharacterized delta-60 repeat protein
MTPPKVFVSYSHDNDEHARWVTDLAFILRKDFGIDVVIDTWDLKLGADLPKFMEGLTQADRVLMVCSDGYVARCDGTDNTGVAYEKKLMSARLRKDVYERSLIPIVRNNSNSQSKLPAFMGDASYINFEDNTRYYDNIKRLAADIHGVDFAKPAIGINPFVQGYDIVFGRDGKCVLPWKKLNALRLCAVEERLLVAGTIDGVPCTAAIDLTGQVDSNFGTSGLLQFIQTDLLYGHGHDDFYVNDIYPFEGGTLVIPRFDIGTTKKHPVLFDFAGNIVSHSSFGGQNYQGICVVDRSSLLTSMADGSCLILLNENVQPNTLINPTGTLEIQGFTQNWVRVRTCNDHIYIFGNGGGNKFVSRLSNDGKLDQTFGEGGSVNVERFVSFNQITDVIEQNDGRLIVGGHGNEANLVRLHADGTIDSSFGDNGIVQFRANYRSTCERLAFSGGMLLFAGEEYSGNDVHNVLVARLSPDGSPDNSFYGEGFFSIHVKGKNQFRDMLVNDKTITVLCQSDTDAPLHNKAAIVRIHQ